MADSTVQVIGYWDIGEKQTYLITEESYRIQDTDTLDRNATKYFVDISIADSTATEYLINWHYRDFTDNQPNPIHHLSAMAKEGLTVQVKTDENGKLLGISNWKAINKHMSKTLKKAKKVAKKNQDYKFDLEKLTHHLASLNNYTNEFGKEYAQFYYFHGLQYELNEVYEAVVDRENRLGAGPLQIKMSVFLDEIFEENESFVLRSVEESDSDQLTAITHEYLKQNASHYKLGNINVKELPKITHIKYIGAELHAYGWPLLSMESIEANSENNLKVIDRTIDLQ